MKPRRAFILLLAAALLVAPGAAHACEMCRDAVANNMNSASESAGLNFNASILGMLVGVFTVMGLVGRVMYKSVNGETPLKYPIDPPQ